MKKYLISLSAVLLLVASCTKFKDEASQPVIVTNAPTITISAVGDSTFTATITPTEGTGYYSYAIQKGAKKSLDSATLFKVGYKSSSIVYGTKSYEKAKTTTITLKAAAGILPNTEYQVYAVAASGQGQIGSVVNASVVTGDKLKPTFKWDYVDSTMSVATSANKLAITFSESVKVGKGKVYASYYRQSFADNSPTFLGTKEVATKNLSVSGTKGIVAVDDTPGIYAVVTWDKGAFTDLYGNECDAFKAGGYDDGGYDTDRYQFKGANIRVPVVAWTILQDTNVKEDATGDMRYYILDPATEYLQFGFSKKGIVDDISNYFKLEKTYEDGSSITNPNFVPTFGFKGDSVLLVDVSGDLTSPADQISFTIPEGALEDTLGNPNAEFNTGLSFFYSYGIHTEDYVGVYHFVQRSSFATFEKGIILDTAATGFDAEASANYLYIKRIASASSHIAKKYPKLKVTTDSVRGTHYRHEDWLGLPSSTKIGTMKEKLNKADSLKYGVDSTTWVVYFYPKGAYEITSDPILYTGRIAYMKVDYMRYLQAYLWSYGASYIWYDGPKPTSAPSYVIDYSAFEEQNYEPVSFIPGHSWADEAEGKEVRIKVKDLNLSR